MQPPTLLQCNPGEHVVLLLRLVLILIVWSFSSARMSCSISQTPCGGLSSSRGIMFLQHPAVFPSRPAEACSFQAYCCKLVTVKYTQPHTTRKVQDIPIDQLIDMHLKLIDMNPTLLCVPLQIKNTTELQLIIYCIFFAIIVSNHIFG